MRAIVAVFLLVAALVATSVIFVHQGRIEHLSNRAESLMIQLKTEEDPEKAADIRAELNEIKGELDTFLEP